MRFITMLFLMSLLQACGSTGSSGVTAASANGPHPSEQVLANTDFDQIIAATLKHPSVAMYLHPEVDGRVPVRVAMGAPFDGRAIRLNLYGQPVVTVRNSDSNSALNMSLQCRATHCNVQLSYPPEGIHGVVQLIQEQGQWRVETADIME